MNFGFKPTQSRYLLPYYSIKRQNVILKINSDE